MTARREETLPLPLGNSAAGTSRLCGSRPLHLAPRIWTRLLLAVSLTPLAAYLGASGSKLWETAAPAVLTIVLVAVSGTVAALVEQLWQRVRELEEQNTGYIRDIYRRDRQQADAQPVAEANDTGSTSFSGVSDNLSEAGPRNEALLATLQEAGRRVSMNLDLDMLLPAIVSTARESLKCGECQVYFWNPRDRSLNRSLPSRSRDDSHYVPRPEAGMARWVLQHRRMLTRSEIEQQKALHPLLEEDPELPDAIAPLAVGGELLGLLVIDKLEHDSPDAARLLSILADLYALGIKNSQLFRRIEQMSHLTEA